jgi:hypothetical protein
VSITAPSFCICVDFSTERNFLPRSSVFTPRDEPCATRSEPIMGKPSSVQSHFRVTSLGGINSCNLYRHISPSDR